MAIITTLKDESGTTTLYPVTKTNAISDSNGTSLDSIISNLQSTKQNAISGIANYTFGTYLGIHGTNMTDFVVDSGTDYIRFFGGTQICWGRKDGDAGTQTISWTKPFVDTNYHVAFAWYDTTSTTGASFRTLAINDRTTTSFTQYFTANTYKSWIAIGRWK